MLNIFKRKKTIIGIADCIDCEKGKSFLVIGAGGTLREYDERIKGFIDRERPVTIGINKMTEFHVPDYHLWTNKQRYRDFGQCISSKSRMMFGGDMPEKLIRKHYKSDYIVVDYVDRTNGGIEYRNGIIYGQFRTAGSLAIMIAHLFGAKDIYVVGMDGYTLYGKEQVEGGTKHHHVYGKGFTDDSDWQKCLEKDNLVYSTLDLLEDYGIKFSILTPTKFEKYYDGLLLGCK